jgi:hypothetical protein
MTLQFGPSLCIDEGCSLTFGQTLLFSIYSKHKGTVAMRYELLLIYLGARTQFCVGMGD